MKKIILNLLSNLLFIIPFLFFISCESGITNKKTQICFNVNIPYFEEDSLGTSSRSVIEEGQNTFTLQVYLISKNGIERNFNRSGINPGESVFVEFNEIPLGEEVKISAELFSKDLLLSYEGETDWIQIISHKNEIQLKLKKNEITITDAETPTINIQPTSDVEIATDDSEEQIPKTLNISATVYDGGDISFQWQEKGSNETWKDINESVTSNAELNESSLSVTLNKGDVKTYRCIVTNTNESVNGEKTASITSDEATVAYVEGTLTSISASYEKNGYQLFSDEFDYSKVKVKETYKGSDNSTETTITVPAASNRYTISKTDDSISAIGYVPYTVTYNNTSTNITSQLRVPVKYKLPQEGLKITGTANTDEWGTVGNPELVAQFTGSATLSVEYAGDGGSFVPSLIYETEDSERADYDVMTSGVDIAWKEDEVALGESSSSVIVDNSTSGTKTYTATITPKEGQTWCIGGSVSASYYVRVCPWEIVLTDSSATSGETVDVTNLTGGTEYTLSASNVAGTNETETITWVSDTENFMISDSTLITPAASTESDQTATISAKVGDEDIASVIVTVKKEIPLGFEGNPITNWDDLVVYLDENTSEDSTIYISGKLEATEPAYIYRPVTIIPVGKVTITLTSSNQDYIFCVNNNLTLQGSESSLITLSGSSGTENSSPLISCITDGVTVNLQYCTLQNANYVSYPYGSALYAGNGSIINMSNCTVQNNIGVALSLQNTGKNIIENTIFTNNQAADPTINASAIYVNDKSANLKLNNCSFSNNINTVSSTIGELGIEEAASVTIDNTTFASVTDGYNIYAYFAPSLTLKGSLSIPTLYFNNNYGDSSLGIVCGEGLALKEDALPITINPAIYTEYNGDKQVDIELFSLNEGQTVPDGIFTLGNEEYVINSSTGVIEAVSSETAYLDSDGITINSSTIDNTALVTVIAEETTVTNTESSGAFTSGNVTLEPYAIGKYEVTQALYEAVMGSNPSSSSEGDNFPVETVSWYDAVKFCNELTKKTMGEDCCVYTIGDHIDEDNDGDVDAGEINVTADITKNGYRLPTEAEWEFAARGGKPNDSINWNYTYAGSNTVDDVAWHYGNTDGGTTKTVGAKTPNNLALYDMSGNVNEWCNDSDSSDSRYAVFRGGWVGDYEEFDPFMCKIYNSQTAAKCYNTSPDIGFRLCRTITE